MPVFMFWVVQGHFFWPYFFGFVSKADRIDCSLISHFCLLLIPWFTVLCVSLIHPQIFDR